MGHKLILGDPFIKAMQDTGLLPEACREVTIHAVVGGVVTVDYQVFGDERLVELADGLVETDDPAKAICR